MTTNAGEVLLAFVLGKDVSPHVRRVVTDFVPRIEAEAITGVREVCDHPTSARVHDSGGWSCSRCEQFIVPAQERSLYDRALRARAEARGYVVHEPLAAEHLPGMAYDARCPECRGIDEGRLAQAMVASGLMKRYTDYANTIPTMTHGDEEQMGREWAAVIAREYAEQ